MPGDPTLRLLASLAAGGLFVLAIPNTGAWWLAFAAWIPLLWAIDGQGVRRAGLYGLASGVMVTYLGSATRTSCPIPPTHPGGAPDITGAVAHVSFVAEVPMIDPTQRTIYARSGEWFPVAAGQLLAGLMANSRREAVGSRGEALRCMEISTTYVP